MAATSKDGHVVATRAETCGTVVGNRAEHGVRGGTTREVRWPVRIVCETKADWRQRGAAGAKEPIAVTTRRNGGAH